MKTALSIICCLWAPSAALGAEEWRPPPPAGDDGFDWVELKSGEWLKGRIKSMQDEKLEFDSEELDLHTFDWKDIRTLRSPRLQSIRLGKEKPAEGTLLVTTDEVQVTNQTGTETHPRAELLAIAPTGGREVDKWTADVSFGISFRSGNTKVVDANTQARFQRRTPITRLTLDYLGNYEKINGTESENNHRIIDQFDLFLSRRLFVRVPDIEYYHDPLQNLNHRLTLGGAVGYDLIKTPRTEWNFAIGPAYQRNWYESVEPGQDKTTDSVAGVLSSRFDMELTKRIDLILEYRGQLTGRRQGSNMHHGVVTLEFEIHKRLTFDTSFVWDRIANPETESDGFTPEKDDFRLITAVGIHF